MILLNSLWRKMVTDDLSAALRRMNSILNLAGSSAKNVEKRATKSQI